MNTYSYEFILLILCELKMYDYLKKSNIPPLTLTSLVQKQNVQKCTNEIQNLMNKPKLATS